MIDNAIEALQSRGGIRVQLDRASPTDIVLEIADDGPGIPEEIRTRVGERGATFGKPSGSGLGLYQTRLAAEEAGGRLEVIVPEGGGTRVRIHLPQVEPPVALPPELDLSGLEEVVIVDDDPSIHQVWESRISSEPGGDAPHLVHHSRGERFSSWATGKEPDRRLFLVDYELQRESESGLDRAVALGFASRTILVTSREDDPTVIAACRAAGVRLLPKALAARVPIRFGPRARSRTVVLVDDDPLVRLSWKIEARAVSLRAFSCAAEFLGAAERLDRDSSVYIDCELGQGVRGEDLAVRAAAMGFRRVFLATGHSARSIEVPDGVSGVVGKDPPAELR